MAVHLTFGPGIEEHHLVLPVRIDTELDPDHRPVRDLCIAMRFLARADAVKEVLHVSHARFRRQFYLFGAVLVLEPLFELVLRNDTAVPVDCGAVTANDHRYTLTVRHRGGQDYRVIVRIVELSHVSVRHFPVVVLHENPARPGDAFREAILALPGIGEAA